MGQNGSVPLREVTPFVRCTRVAAELTVALCMLRKSVWPSEHSFPNTLQSASQAQVAG